MCNGRGVRLGGKVSLKLLKLEREEKGKGDGQP